MKRYELVVAGATTHARVIRGWARARAAAQLEAARTNAAVDVFAVSTAGTRRLRLTVFPHGVTVTLRPFHRRPQI